VVSKAVGGAVVRNRVKRRLREMVRIRFRELTPGDMIVVRALPAASSESRRLAGDFDAAWSRALAKADGFKNAQVWG
jgi:ribonuclease P protein component